MARSLLTPKPILFSGTTPQAPVAGTVDGHMFPNDGKVFCRVTNAAGATRVLTVQTPATYAGHAVADDSISFAASEVKYVGPFNPDLYNVAAGDADAGNVYLNFPAGSEGSFTVEAYKL